ncbi:hypothetical protein SKAU_G00306380 [Synaphobranchus kaupii]|uniref:Uncharacterized protein n=1 Tax=Synaphobranchus kaupii TaxID=118154 RepID=A0A9Q1EQP3_SYNKA|nr:hypothetical protein SKAU_G00306380 [Synaphobranchus kaupii]
MPSGDVTLALAGFSVMNRAVLSGDTSVQPLLAKSWLGSRIDTGARALRHSTLGQGHTTLGHGGHALSSSRPKLVAGGYSCAREPIANPRVHRHLRAERDGEVTRTN